MRNRLLGGNWKENSSLRTFDMMEDFKSNLFTGHDTFIAVPFPYIQKAKEVFPRHIMVGAQDCSQFKNGPYTGEVSASMIKEMGAEYVIIGHSERRRWFNETSGMIGKKIRNACDEGLNVVLCIGESQEDRECNRHLEVIRRQMYALRSELFQRDNVDIAYEPVWSIGTGVIPTNEQIREVFLNIKEWGSDIRFDGRVVYGGSVSMLNCQSILEIDEVDGFLVGATSLNMDFCMISSEMSTRMAG